MNVVSVTMHANFETLLSLSRIWWSPQADHHVDIFMSQVEFRYDFHTSF